MKSYLPLCVDGEEYRLRLTMAGQRALRQQYDEDILTFLLSAAMEPEKLCALLTQALTWPESGNAVTDGVELFDRLVDGGWQGQAAFAGLAFDLGAASGLLTRSQADELTESVSRALDGVFEALRQK